jgi:predicted phosphodiesterase
VSTIIALSDTHFPWYSDAVLSAVYRGIRKYSPKYIVHVGDLYDFFSFARFARSQNVCTPKEELTRGREAAEKFWKTVKQLAPRAKCFQLRGNHDDRPLHRILQNSPELELFLSVDPWFQFAGVETLNSEREELVIDNIVFMHGFLTEIGAHCRDMQKNVVRGHSHIGYTYYKKTFDKSIWELNCGYCADRDQIPLSYTQQSKFSRWTPGYGIIDERGPRFISS